MPLFGLGEIVKLPAYASRGALHALVARENHLDEAGGVVIATVAFIGFFALLGIIFAILAFVVLARGSGHRGPYVWLLLAALAFALFNLLDVPRLVVWYNDNRPSRKFFAGMNAASAVFFWWTDAFLFAAALFVLWNRRNAAALASGARPGALRMVKLVLDVILIVAIIVLAVARSAYLANANYDLYDGNIGYTEYSEKVRSYLGMGYGLVVIMLLLVLDVYAFAITVRSRMPGPDQPSTKVLVFVAPMFVVHWLWRTAMTIYGALEWYDKFSPSSATEDIISLVGTLEAGLVMGGIILVLLVVGFKRDAWDGPGGRHSVYSAHTVTQSMYSQGPSHFEQPMYQPQQFAQYPQQQQQQWHAQPGVAYAPAHAQHQPAPSFPQV